MSRSSKGFADFFPTAPSVLQQKRSKASQDRRRHRSSSAGLAQPPHTLSAPPASSDEEAEGSTPVNETPNGEVNAMPHSLTHEESECVNGDIAHEVGSASSTSTASSIFSAGHRDANMLYKNGPHKSTSLTPLTNIDSSPRANGMNSSPKRSILDQHISTINPPRSPSSSRMMEETSSLNDLAPDLATPSNGPQARPGRGEIKGFKAVYDPDLDKALRGKEKRTRQVQYQPFGEEVRSASTFCSQVT